jgi:4-hydroxybenzoyl-CoA reductase subunit beta
MKLPPFEYLAPPDMASALKAKEAWGENAVWLAGGTDLLVRAKLGLVAPQAVISLKHLAHDFSVITEEDGWLKIGAFAPLGKVAGHARVRELFPGLAEAVASIGAETLQQRVGTLGGNLCAQTRCIYYNQSAFWRSGLAPCFKLGGEVCHPGGSTADRCRSLCQSDGAVMLAALGAEVRLLSVAGERQLGLHDFYTGKGEAPLDLGPAELLSEVLIPLPPAGAGSAYYKLGVRTALDFPMISAAAWLVAENRVVSQARVTLGAAYAAPLPLADAMAPLKGTTISESVLHDTAQLARRHAEPFFIDNQTADTQWRREMVAVVVERALARAAHRAGGA